MTLISAYFTAGTTQVPRLALVGAQVAGDGNRYDVESDAVYLGYDLIVTREDVLDNVARIVKLNRGASTYRGVMKDPEWRSYYGVAQRPYLYVNRLHPLGNPRQLESAPCSGCGLCLPLPQLQIDHVHPMAGAPLPPILKVFRALGLTLAPPKGRLGQGALLNHVSDGPTAIGAIAGNKLAKGNVAVLTRQTKLLSQAHSHGQRYKRYSTNELGNVLLSLFWKSPNGMRELTTACRNSLLNLRPLCCTCNSFKSDTARVEAV